MQKIYFGSGVVMLSKDLVHDTNVVAGNVLYIDHWDPSITGEILKRIGEERNEVVIVQHPDTESVIESFKSHFTVILAAGGLVTSGNNMLLIYRRGKWDLPKGKLDEGEDLEACAIREVEEETGLKDVTLHPLILKTYHTYKEKDQAILKETFWYHMSVTGLQQLSPQVDEDIQECRWVSIQQVHAYAQNLQPSVADVIKQFQDGF